MPARNIQRRSDTPAAWAISWASSNSPSRLQTFGRWALPQNRIPLSSKPTSPAPTPRRDRFSERVSKHAPALPEQRGREPAYSNHSENIMKTNKTLIAVLAAAGVAAAGVAVAQSTNPGGSGMPGMHQSMHAMKGGMHQGMHEMKGGMQGMHEMKGGMQGMHEMKGGMHGGQGHGGSGHSSGQTTGDQSVGSLAFAAANEKMHREMAITFSGDADADFVRGMIPHHQGAIDMAKIVIAFGKDPEVRKLAEEIVKAQDSEILLMRSWLQKRGQ
jgi:uncharacterized protein (DUF305 family)